MELVQVSVRLSPVQLKRAQRALRTKTTSETVKKALDFVAEKAVHDAIIRRYSGVGRPDAFQE